MLGLQRIVSTKFKIQNPVRVTQNATTGNTQRLVVQPIIVSNANGTNTAEYFGDQEQEFDIKPMVDEIFLQANVDVGG